MSAVAVSTRAGSGVAGAGGEGAGELGGGSVWMGGVGLQVEISVVIDGELDAASCLLFDFKDGGADSVCKNHLPQAKTAKLS